VLRDGVGLVDRASARAANRASYLWGRTLRWCLFPAAPVSSHAPTGALASFPPRPPGSGILSEENPVADAPALRSDLDRLARNLRWFWHEPARQVLADLAEHSRDGAAGNPAAVVAGLSDARLEELADDPERGERIAAAVRDLDEYLAASDTWFDRHGGDRDRLVVYLSAEFALADCLYTYSGGLGVLAGDHVRSASDLGLPFVGISLAYDDGYFHQRIAADGAQVAEPAANRWDELPVAPVLRADGSRLTVEVETGDGIVEVTAWSVEVGRVRVYLLDTGTDPVPDHRKITAHLYGGDDEMRLLQELVLGVGGVRMLAALGLEPSVLHLNEGHAAFAGLERLRPRLAAGSTLAAAVEDARTELVFTTHTPVPAGHDRFPRDLAARHLAPLAERLGVPFERLFALATGAGEPHWNQTVLSLHLAGRTNGVARLHGRVSREMWHHLWPGTPVEEVPIDHVTNGVHVERWVGPEVARLVERQVGPGWEHQFGPDAWEPIRDLDPAALWTARQAARRRLIALAQDRLAAQAERLGTVPDGAGLDPDVLTIGFARRFATYKRATLIAHDAARLARLLTDRDRPVQLLLAGKAHPADRPGQQLIRELVALTHDPRFEGRIAFLEGYDLELGAALTSGADVWLNNPLRPLEASGTSGMKAAMNGVLNLSVLDGWWDEAVSDLSDQAEVGFGWAVGGTAENRDRASQDAQDAAALYSILEDEVVPTFHDRDGDGVPQRWVAMMKDSIRVLTPPFSTHRMVVDYAERYGLLTPALAR
jgi:glycogen phosphorylase